jgi:diguanylate cyclase (GGDEF)-like protein
MTPLRLLLIEDSVDDAELVVRELSRAGYSVSVRRVETPDALAAALNHRWDVAVADYSMPQFSGTAALTLLREYNADVPFIFVSGTISEDAVVTAMQNGAQNFIRKTDLARLPAIVDRHVREAATRVARPQAASQLVHLAVHDALTDLPNRVLLHDRLRQGILAAQRAHEALAVIVLAVGGLDVITEEAGSGLGDRVIQELASRLRGILREGDTVARLGDHRFAMMLPGTHSDGAVVAARKIVDGLSRPFVLDGHTLSLSATLGVASASEQGTNPDDLLHKAGLALDVATAERTPFAVYAPHRHDAASQHSSLTAELREGIEQAQFSLDYQPIVHGHTGRVLCVEALARWNHPSRGKLLPSQFIELAETSWLIEPLTMVLLDRAIAEWASRDPIPWVSVAVNLSPKCLRDQDLPDRIGDLLRLHGAPASSLVLEITDNALLLDTPRATTCLSRLKDMGIKLAVDGFGSSTSPAGYVRRLPIDRVKIGRPLVSALEHGDESLVQSALDLVRGRSLFMVAVGIESAEGFERVRDLGCEAAQGQFIAPPAPLADSRRWVARRNAAASL